MQKKRSDVVLNDQDEQDEPPFKVGNYVLVIRQPEEDENTFGVIISKVKKHWFIVRDASGDETLNNDDDMLHAEPGDKDWFVFILPAGACIVNLIPVDEFYTMEPTRRVDFPALARKLKDALSKKFVDIEFAVSTIFEDGEDGFYTIHNNADIADAKIGAFVGDFIAKVPFFDELWYIDNDVDDASDKEVDVEADRMLREKEDEEDLSDDDDDEDE